MIEKPIVIYTDHEASKVLCYNFAKGSNSLMCHVNKFKEYNKTIATYGYIRGTGEVLRKVKNFIYMDHGYFNQSERLFIKDKVYPLDYNGYFRIVHNNFWHNGLGNKPDDRFKKLSINIKNIKKNGEYIILSETDFRDKKFFNIQDWTDKTIKEIRKHSDRKIVLHSRESDIKLNDLLKNAWAFVSDHSSAGIKSMIEGVPAYFTNPTLSKIGSIDNIEKHEINYQTFNNLAYDQWTLEEIASGEAWENLLIKNNE